MKYAFSVTENGVIYSLDMLRLRVGITNYRLDKMLHQFIDDERHKISYVSPLETREFKWKYFITCKYVNDKSIKMGFHMNGVSTDKKEQGFIEFNPNSFADIHEFWKDYDTLLSYFRFPEIARFDVAIDIPIIRDKIALVKDNRMYCCYRKSPQDFTETLGQRNTVGRVKLYNKQIESKLDYPLTRLEITGDLENVHIPRVIDLRELPHSEKVLVQSVLKNDCFTLSLADLSLHHRGVILTLLKNNQIRFSDSCIEAVVAYAKTLAHIRN